MGAEHFDWKTDCVVDVAGNAVDEFAAAVVAAVDDGVARKFAGFVEIAAADAVAVVGVEIAEASYVVDDGDAGEGEPPAPLVEVAPGSSGSSRSLDARTKDLV